MTAASQERVNSASRKLLATLKEEKLVLDWRKRQQTRADVKVTIEKVLDDMLPPAYTPEVFEKKNFGGVPAHI